MGAGGGLVEISEPSFALALVFPGCWRLLLLFARLALTALLALLTAPEACDGLWHYSHYY